MAHSVRSTTAKQEGATEMPRESGVESQHEERTTEPKGRLKRVKWSKGPPCRPGSRRKVDTTSFPSSPFPDKDASNRVACCRISDVNHDGITGDFDDLYQKMDSRALIDLFAWDVGPT